METIVEAKHSKGYAKGTDHHSCGDQGTVRNQRRRPTTREVTEKGILFKPIPKLLDMAGIDAGYGTPEEIKKDNR